MVHHQSCVPTENYKLVLYYVKPPPPVFYSYFDAAGQIFAGDFVLAMDKHGRELANPVMERAEAICRKVNTSNNINMEKVVGTEDAKDVICSTVQKLRADILAMRSHGCGLFKRALLGSVSDHCAKHAKCPLVIVKHP